MCALTCDTRRLWMLNWCRIRDLVCCANITGAFCLRTEREISMALHPSTTPVLNSNSTIFLDFLRALAANLVLLGHASELFRINIRVPVGLIGVGLFFILSGFLILQSSLARIHRPGPHFIPYMIDRFARIFTAYIPVLVLVALVNSAIEVGHWGQEGTSTGFVAFIGNLFLLQDYPIFQIVRRLIGDALYIRPYNTAEPFWTIPIEFWIYVVFGLSFFCLANRERLVSPLGFIIGLIAVPVVVWNAAAGGGNGLSLVWLVGALAGYVWVGHWHHSKHKLQIGLIVLVTGFVCLSGRGLKVGWNFQDLGIVLCETLMLLGGLSVMEGLRPLPNGVRVVCTSLASYSYSLYLAHNTVLIVMQQLSFSFLGRATLPIALVTAHVVAVVLYLFFERHYRQVGIWLKAWSSHFMKVSPSSR